jgi:predicted MFS family arabinose efflux permease
LHCSQTSPKDKLATAQGAGSAAISTALGLVLGAYVVQNLGWQYAFHTAAILSVILFVIVVVVIKRDVSNIKCKIDYIGALLLSLGIAPYSAVHNRRINIGLAVA